ncbi:hypothetical protein Taro_005996 [Colocasia esculenta]|uniref:CCHC-type domain-containing protein n=1 Tax=Colocasia esculenta TaxID=4460 RepID=A0A843TU43_COLES|nr:hypothetical protein [Colocasia esculenta]
MGVLHCSLLGRQETRNSLSETVQIQKNIKLPIDCKTPNYKENVGENYDVDCDANDNVKQSTLQQKEEEHRQLAEAVDESSPVMPSMDLPTELQCSLCNKIFKEAVMIPCCQHSIRTALVDKGCCPKCSSTKCRIEDLLPNLSLRHAIELFLEAQIPILGLDKVTPRYAPDGESGIQAKEASCALSIRQLEHTLPESPSLTGKGSNKVVTEPTCESLTGMKRMAPGTGSSTFRLDGDKPAKSIILLHKDRRLDEKDDGHDSKHMPCFEQHGNFIKLSQSVPQKEEATSTTKKKKGLFATSADAGGTTTFPPSRLKKGERNCFMCGSPDHLIRDCPAASNPYQFLQTGNAAFHGGMPAYGAAYWHNNSFPYMRPYANMYGTPGMLPFDPSIKSVPPFGISYMSPMYASLPVPWMGGMGSPMMSGASHPFSHADVIEFQDGEQRRKNLKGQIEREEAFDEGDNDYHCPDSRRRLNDHKAQLDKGVAISYSDEDPRVHRKHAHGGYLHASSHQRPTSTSEDEEIHSGSRKHEKTSNIVVSGRDSRTHYSERSYSDQQDDSDGSDQHTREKGKHRHGSSSKKQSEKRGKHNSDHIHKNQSQSWRETCDDREKIMNDHKKHTRKQLGHSEAAFVPDSSGDQKQSLKEEISHSSRHTKHKEKFSKDQLEDDRWELVDGLGEVYESDHWYHKHRRTR